MTEANEWNRQFGARLRLARQTRGMMQRELAHKVGVDRSTVANLEAGIQATTAQRAVAIAEALGVDLGWLLTGRRDELTTERLREVRDAADTVLSDLLDRLLDGVQQVAAVPDPSPAELEPAREG